MQSPGLSPLWTVHYQRPEGGSHSATPELQQEATELAVQRDIQTLRVTGSGHGCWYCLPSRGLEASLSEQVPWTREPKLPALGRGNELGGLSGVVPTSQIAGA